MTEAAAEVIAMFILATPGFLAALAYGRISPRLLAARHERRRFYLLTVYAWILTTLTAVLLYTANYGGFAGLVLLLWLVFFTAQDIRFLTAGSARRARHNLRVARKEGRPL